MRGLASKPSERVTSMCKKALVNWAIWIGVISGIYCIIYILTVGAYTMNVVLPGYHVMCATFTALPIFFTAGAQRKDYFSYVCSNVMGVLWGMLYLVAIDRLAPMMPLWLNLFLSVGIICVVECALHFTVLSKLPISVVPAQFGAISSSFWCSNLAIAVLGTAGQTAVNGVYNFAAFPMLAITLVGGATLALLCNEGLNFIDAETGNWKMPGSGK